MRLGLIAAALAALAALAVPAAAEMQQVQPGRYRCAPAPGEGADQQIVPLQVGREMRVAFRLIREEKGWTSPPTAAIILQGPNGRSHIALGKAVNDPFEMYAAVS